MENAQTVAETLQPLDFGMLVDLTDCYLTMGLPHPSGANAFASVCPNPHRFASGIPSGPTPAMDDD
jgi:hypothetical protein